MVQEYLNNGMATWLVLVIDGLIVRTEFEAGQPPAIVSFSKKLDPYCIVLIRPLSGGKSYTISYRTSVTIELYRFI